MRRCAVYWCSSSRNSSDEGGFLVDVEVFLFPILFPTVRVLLGSPGDNLTILLAAISSS